MIVRVEGGLLFEIEKTFRDIFFDSCAPKGNISQGSLILVGFCCTLGTAGLESCCGNLVRDTSALASRVGDRVKIVPLVPLPWGDRFGGNAVRAV